MGAWFTSNVPKAQKLFWTHPMEFLGDMGPGEFCLETVFVSVQDRCTVCAKHAIGLGIILDEIDGTPM
jgi:hypothetical protein